MIFWWMWLTIRTSVPNSRAQWRDMKRSIVKENATMSNTTSTTSSVCRHYIHCNFSVDTFRCQEMCSCVFYREWGPMIITSSWRKMTFISLIFSSHHKFTIAVWMVAYWVVGDLVDDYMRMSESTCFEAMYKFNKAVVHMFDREYLREPNVADSTRRLKITFGRVSWDAWLCGLFCGAFLCTMYNMHREWQQLETKNGPNQLGVCRWVTSPTLDGHGSNAFWRHCQTN